MVHTHSGHGVGLSEGSTEGEADTGLLVVGSVTMMRTRAPSAQYDVCAPPPEDM
jgi:hypothetical protein